MKYKIIYILFFTGTIFSGCIKAGEQVSSYEEVNVIECAMGTYTDLNHAYKERNRLAHAFQKHKYVFEVIEYEKYQLNINNMASKNECLEFRRRYPQYNSFVRSQKETGVPMGNMVVHNDQASSNAWKIQRNFYQIGAFETKRSAINFARKHGKIDGYEYLLEQKRGEDSPYKVLVKGFSSTEEAEHFLRSFKGWYREIETISKNLGKINVNSTVHQNMNANPPIHQDVNMNPPIHQDVNVNPPIHQERKELDRKISKSLLGMCASLEAELKKGYIGKPLEHAKKRLKECNVKKNRYLEYYNQK